MITNKTLKEQYKMKVANKMRNYGDTDFGKKVMRVNKKKAARSDNKGELLDSIVHEANHAKHPQMHERTVRKKTAKDIAHMNKQQKQRYYKMFS